MKRYPILALVVLLLAILGALLHPFSLLLSLAPFDTRGFEGFLQEARLTIADLLGWGVLGLLLSMLAYIALGRLLNRASKSAVAGLFAEAEELHSSQRSQPAVVVAITAYNDAEATAQAVRDYKIQPCVVKVLVIDNNSTDQTVELAEAAGATVIREPRQGYGFACIRGLSEALNFPETDVVVLTEGDGTFVAGDTEKFVAYMHDAEFVVGNRTVRGLVASDSQMDHFFTWGNMAVAMLLRLRFWDGRFLGPAGLTDVGCTFRAVRRDALERILPDLSVGGNHFSVHMLLVAMAHGISVVEIPIRFRRRVGESKGASKSLWKGFEAGVAMIWHILSYSPKPVAARPGVIVERDGVIIRHRDGEPHGRTRVEFVPGAREGLAAMSRRGHKIVVVGDRFTHDRAGIPKRLARGIDARIAAEVANSGGRVDAFVVCPHRADAGCSCRHAGLLLRAARRSPLNLANAVVVSDRPQFLNAAADLGCKTILVRDGASRLENVGTGTAQVHDFSAAIDLVLGSETRPARLAIMAAQPES
jgi:histidinol phosphatase-like enzyme